MAISTGIYTRLGVPPMFDPTHALVTSPVLRPRVLALVRSVLAVYTLFALIFDIAWDGARLHTAGSFFSFFTQLAYIGLCAYFWAAAVQTLAYVRARECGYPLQRWPRALQFLHVLLLSTISSFPILVTIVFWSILASPTTFATRFSSWSNISVHALNTVFALFEILLTHAGPTPWTHLPFLIALLACYLGVAYITRATQGFYPYAFLNPHIQHARLAGWIVGIAVAEIIIFSIVRGVCVARERLAARLRRGGAASVGSEATQDWETVERPGSRLV